jgi:hypothetical protein
MSLTTRQTQPNTWQHLAKQLAYLLFVVRLSLTREQQAAGFVQVSAAACWCFWASLWAWVLLMPVHELCPCYWPALVHTCSSVFVHTVW